MQTPHIPQRPDRIDCVGVLCFRGDEVLLIKRGKPPRQGDWSIPGGRIEKGETQADAALRELFEETHVTAALGAKITTIDADFEGFKYRLHDYIAIWQHGEPRAGDDAAEARFIRVNDIEALKMWPKTEAVIRQAYASL